MKVSRRAEFSEIPIIDIEALGTDSPAEAKVVAAIRDASEHMGFFYIFNHGYSSELENIFKACERFFSMPQSERDQLHLIKSPNFRGYLPIGVLGTNTERPRDLLESFNIATELGPDDFDVNQRKPLHGSNQWPANLPGFREDVLRYYGAMECLMYRLLQGFALALDLPRDAFDALFRKPLTQMRLLHYPAQEVVKDNMIGARAHRDFGFFTILLQDGVGGLEVSNQSAEWVVVPPIENMFVVNVAEMLKLVTNGRFLSSLHRVINRYGRERYSVPFFVNPSYDVTLVPLPHCIDSDHPARANAYHVGENMYNFYRNLWPSAGKSAA